MASEAAAGGLGRFSALTRGWFEGAFAAPTQAQVGAWDALASDQDVLVVAPTGSGKTLAAFLSAIDRLATAPPVPERERLRVLYISPLKALAADIERNLRSPLAGLRAAAARLDAPLPDITVGMRTGDTPADVRRRFPAHPPDILITTPESLFLLLTSRAREALTYVDTVIVDEVHSVVATKRGAHLALSLERLDELLDRPARRIGLSATVRPLDEVARFLGGPRPVTVLAPPSGKALDPSVGVPAAGSPGGGHGRHRRALRRPGQRVGLGRARPLLDLAPHRRAAGRADPGPPLDHRVRQLPPPGRTALGQPQRPRRDRAGPRPTPP